MNTEQIIEQITPFIFEYGVSIITSIAILWIGLWLTKRISRTLKKLLTKQNVDPGLRGFITSLVSIGLKILLMVVVLGQIGIATTSFVAILGAAGLAVGLALQGSLANFAGGALILFFKPFKVGDFIESQGYKGTVTSIQIFVTTLLTPENKTVIVPNGELSNNSITNYSTSGTMRVDITVGISYDADIKKAKEVALRILKEQKKVLNDPEPTINVAELADSSVNLAIRPWVQTADYWDVYFTTLEEIKYAFDKEDIGIPYPHQVVQIVQDNK